MRQCGTALSMPQNYDKWFGNAHKQATDRQTTTAATRTAANHNNNRSWNSNRSEPQRRTEHILFLWCCFPCCFFCCFCCCCSCYCCYCCWSSRAGWRKTFRVEGNVISFFLSSVLVFVFFSLRFPTDKTTASRTTLRKSLPKITELKRQAEGAAGGKGEEEGKTIATIASARCAQ